MGSPRLWGSKQSRQYKRERRDLNPRPLARQANTLTIWVTPSKCHEYFYGFLITYYWSSLTIITLSSPRDDYSVMYNTINGHKGGIFSKKLPFGWSLQTILVKTSLLLSFEVPQAVMTIQPRLETVQVDYFVNIDKKKFVILWVRRSNPIFITLWCRMYLRWEKRMGVAALSPLMGQPKRSKDHKISLRETGAKGTLASVEDDL